MSMPHFSLQCNKDGLKKVQQRPPSHLGAEVEEEQGQAEIPAPVTLEKT